MALVAGPEATPAHVRQHTLGQYEWQLQAVYVVWIRLATVTIARNAMTSTCRDTFAESSLLHGCSVCSVRPVCSACTCIHSGMGSTASALHASTQPALGCQNKSTVHLCSAVWCSNSVCSAVPASRAPPPPNKETTTSCPPNKVKPPRRNAHHRRAIPQPLETWVANVVQAALCGHPYLLLLLLLLLLLHGSGLA
jgi:hypothetical protein